MLDVYLHRFYMETQKLLHTVDEHSYCSRLSAAKCGCLLTVKGLECEFHVNPV